MKGIKLRTCIRFVSGSSCPHQLWVECSGLKRAGVQVKWAWCPKVETKSFMGAAWSTAAGIQRLGVAAGPHSQHCPGAEGHG